MRSKHIISAGFSTSFLRPRNANFLGRFGVQKIFDGIRAKLPKMGSFGGLKGLRGGLLLLTAPIVGLLLLTDPIVVLLLLTDPSVVMLLINNITTIRVP